MTTFVTTRKRTARNRSAQDPCDAHGRQQGLAGRRDNAPSHTSAARNHWCGGRRRDRRARAGFEARRRTK
ncbi:ribosome modulation factor [Schaalia odontolytica]|nr:ribosome modulation factor [Schaalia odontolytica]